MNEGGLCKEDSFCGWREGGREELAVPHGKLDREIKLLAGGMDHLNNDKTKPGAKSKTIMNLLVQQHTC